MGRKTLDVALQMGGGSFSGSSMTTYVFSRSKPTGERDGLAFINQSPAAFIRKLRKQPGKDIWFMGGGELARDFLKADLVDQLHLGIVPYLARGRHSALPGWFSPTGLRIGREHDLLKRADRAQIQTEEIMAADERRSALPQLVSACGVLVGRTIVFCGLPPEND
jgi:dihydrofolate reductase